MILNGELIPDLLFPKGDGKNRIENFVVDFDDIMQNECENIVLGLLSNDDYLEKLPVLQKFKDMINRDTELDLYYETAPYDKYDFIDYLAGPNNHLTIDEKDEICNYGFSIDTYPMQSTPNMMYALSELADTTYVKSISVLFDRPIYEHDIKYIMAHFLDKADKVNLCEDADMLTVAKEDKELKKYTTYFSGNIDTFWQILIHPDEYNAKSIAFILCDNTSNIATEVKENGKFKTHELYNEEIDKMHNYIDFTFNRYVPRPFFLPVMDNSLNVNLPFKKEGNDNE